MNRYFALLVGLAFVIFFQSGVSALDVTLDTCGYTFVDNNTYVTLNATMSLGGGANCFFCDGFENITIDCAGYGVSASGSEPRFFRNDGCDNITVKNCTIVNPYYFFWNRGSTYDTRHIHVYDVNYTKYTTDSSGSFFFSLFGGGSQIFVDLHNVIYEDDGSEHMYYMEGVNHYNSSHYNVTYLGGGGSRWRTTGGTPEFYQVEYFSMNITTVNVSSGMPLPNVDVTVVDSSGRFSVSGSTDAEGSLYDFFVPYWYNITTSSGTGGSEFAGNPQNITGNKAGFDVNSTQFSATQDGTFLLYMEETVPDVMLPQVSVESPSGNYYYPDVHFNITMNESHPDVCLVNWGQGNYSMMNSSGDWNYFNDSMSEGSYLVEFFCNDTSGNVGINSTLFVIDLPPVIAIDDCMVFQRSDTIYRMSHDITTDVVSNCIGTGSEVNLTLDCAGYIFYDNQTGGGTEPFLINNPRDFTFRNCNIINFSHVILNGNQTPIIFVYNSIIQSSDHNTPDFVESIAAARNYTVYFYNSTFRGTGAGSFFFETDNANLTAFMINSSWSNVNPLFTKYLPAGYTQFAIYRMFEVPFVVLDVNTSAQISGANLTLTDFYGNSYELVTDANGTGSMLLTYYNCSTIGSGVINFNCGENYYNPHSFVLSKAGFYAGAGMFNVTSGDGVVLTLEEIPSPSPSLTQFTSLLSGAGDGLGNFISAITDPTVNIILGLGMVGGILMILMAIVIAFSRIGRGNRPEDAV